MASNTPSLPSLVLVLAPFLWAACATTAPVRPDFEQPARLEAPVMTGRDTALAYERFLRAELQRLDKNALEAAKEYRAALETSYAPGGLLIRFAGSLVDCGRVAAARHVLERVPLGERSTASYWLVAARVFDAEGQTRDRLAALHKAVSLEKEDIEPLLALAEALEDPVQKRELLTLAAARQPGSDRAHLGLAQLHIEQGRPFAARRHIDAYLELRPDQREIIRRRFGDAP